MKNLSDIPNVGPVLEKMLNEIGVFTPEELYAMDSKQAFIKIKLADSTACLHMLYGLHGAIEGVRDTQLSKDVKNDLKQFYNSL